MVTLIIFFTIKASKNHYVIIFRLTGMTKRLYIDGTRIETRAASLAAKYISRS